MVTEVTCPKQYTILATPKIHRAPSPLIELENLTPQTVQATKWLKVHYDIFDYLS